MNLKQRRLLKHFLEMLEKQLENQQTDKVNPLFLDFFSRKELMEMVQWLYTNYDKNSLAEKSDSELLEIIGTDLNILSYTIHKWTESLTATPTLSQKEKTDFFENRQLEIHYLYHKPTDEWNEYDVSNYYSLLWKHGKTTRTFAIFATDVAEKDKYAVTTKPSFFFDTEEEALVEIKNIIKEKKFKREELKIMSLWTGQNHTFVFLFFCHKFTNFS